MDPVQRELADPSAFRAQVDPKLVEAEINRTTPPGEPRSLMLAELASLGGDVSIARVVDDYRSLKDELHRTQHKDLYEFGVEAALGAEFLANLLIRRADRLAASIKPGAESALAGRFGER